jgi:hypothetical protein
MVAIDSASDSHDEIYCSVALPLKIGMAFVSSRRFSAVMSSVIGFVGMVEIWYGLRFEIRVFKGDCYIHSVLILHPNAPLGMAQRCNEHQCHHNLNSQYLMSY